jgi:hypothetical protein
MGERRELPRGAAGADRTIAEGQATDTGATRKKRAQDRIFAGAGLALASVAPGSSKIFAASMDTAPRASGELAIELAITVDALPIFEEARPAFRRQVNPDFLRAIGCDDFPHPPIRVVGGRARRAKPSCRPPGGPFRIGNGYPADDYLRHCREGLEDYSERRLATLMGVFRISLYRARLMAELPEGLFKQPFDKGVCNSRALANGAFAFRREGRGGPSTWPR